MVTGTPSSKPLGSARIHLASDCRAASRVDRSSIRQIAFSCGFTSRTRSRHARDTFVDGYTFPAGNSGFSPDNAEEVLKFILTIIAIEKQKADDAKAQEDARKAEEDTKRAAAEHAKELEKKKAEEAKKNPPKAGGVSRWAFHDRS
jgi:hypothetical protein